MSQANLTAQNPGRENGLSAERMERRPPVTPPVDIYENADEILVLADIPGARADAITVRLDKNELTLHARGQEQSSGKPVLGTWRNADYSRTFLVPRGIDGERISADMNAGVLRIHLPKSDSLKPRKITVRTG
jgi:HSP20 family molecular chaperone IbpA